jgi:hypothetical protein
MEPNMFPFSKKKIVQKKKKPKIERDPLMESLDPFELREDEGPRKKQKKCIPFERESFEEMDENVNIEQYFEGIFCSQLEQESEIIESFGLENDLFKDNVENQ